MTWWFAKLSEARAVMRHVTEGLRYLVGILHL